jgi:hypothetical protein
MKQSSTISVVLLGFFLSALCSGLAWGETGTQPSIQLSPEFRSIVEAALSLRKAEFEIVGSSVNVTTKRGVVNLPLHELQQICISHPEDNCLDFAITYFWAALTENLGIGRLEDVLKHMDKIDPFDPRIPLFRYHQLREDEKVLWSQALGLRKDPLVEIAYRQEMDALLSKGMVYSTKQQSDFTEINPSQVDEAMEALVRYYESASPDHRMYLRSKINSDQGWYLLTFAKRAAVRARRSKNPDLVSAGLTSLAIDNLAQGDVRDSLVAIGLLFHVAKALDLETTQLFNRAAAISGPPMAAVFSDFLKRNDLNRIHSNMGWREVTGPNGIGYIWDIDSP